MRINTNIRVLHFSIVVTVIYQLASSIWMAPPEPGKLVGFDAVLFSWHVFFIGWAAFILGCVYAMVKFTEGDDWGRMIPWFSGERRAAFFKSARRELPDVLTGKLAPPEKKGALAGAVHGLGFLLLIALGSTGGYVMNGVRTDGSMTADMNLMLYLHETFGILIWAFLASHVLMVLYHLVLGHPKVLDIFERISIQWKK
ncbi:MAG: cytochrome b/b6 domain-containing protein [Mariprofundaceae bacterium]